MQNRLLFPVPKASYGADLAHLQQLQLADGTGFVIQHHQLKKPRALLIYTHGNATDIGQLQDRRAYYEAQNIEVCLIEFPGYGLSSGSPTVSNCYAAVDATYQYVQTQERLHSVPIIFHGRSLGSGLALYGASTYPCAGVILESAYRSAQRVLLPIRIFPWDYFNSDQVLPQVKVPIFIIHGKRDQVIPFSHGEYLAQHASQLFASCWLDQAGHNDIILENPTVNQHLIDFFTHLSLAPLGD